jgi:hypothetical protein
MKDMGDLLPKGRLGKIINYKKFLENKKSRESNYRRINDSSPMESPVLL